MSEQTALGYALDGIHPRDRTTVEGKNGKVFVVRWTGARDPMNPMNYGFGKRAGVTVCVSAIAFVLTAASSIDSAIAPQAAADFGVSEVAESLATGMYLIGFGLGTLIAGPLSETFGRNPVYIGAMFIFMIWIMGAALAQSFGEQIVFRLLAGFFGSPVLTVAGGTIADVWTPLEKTYAFPLYAITGFGGPVLGPVIGAYLGPGNISWRWSEWLMLILCAVILLIVVALQPETYAPVLLKWKAKHLRDATGDLRFRAEIEVIDATLISRLGVALYRPFEMVLTELIIVLMTLYLTVVYIVLFTFLDGYPVIFGDTYDLNQGLTFIIFVAMFVGIFSVWSLVPIVYKITKKNEQKVIAEGGHQIVPETRLWYAMLAAPAMPISIFWMAWTCYADISIWSPILASTLFGYSVINIFLSAYMYIIDAYTIYAASALTFVALVRYLCAGGMTVVGVPFYNNLGPHWTLTIMGCLSVLLTPIPYALYIWGDKVRTKSKFAVARVV